MPPHAPEPTRPREGCSADGENGFPIAPPTMPVEASLVLYDAACRALAPGTGGRGMTSVIVGHWRKLQFDLFGTLSPALNPDGSVKGCKNIGCGHSCSYF